MVSLEDRVTSYTFGQASVARCRPFIEPYALAVKLRCSAEDYSEQKD